VIEITRYFDAPRERVWRAWTRPEELVKWWGKRGWTAQPGTLVMDVRPGGAFRVVTVHDDDGRTMVSEGVYHEVVEPERLSFGESTVTLTDLGDGRTRMDFRTSARMDETAVGGFNSALDRLAEQLQEEPR
jgi:Activator of Hsp90 ATPase homolog 1-like protein